MTRLFGFFGQITEDIIPFIEDIIPFIISVILFLWEIFSLKGIKERLENYYSSSNKYLGDTLKILKEVIDLSLDWSSLIINIKTIPMVAFLTTFLASIKYGMPKLLIYFLLLVFLVLWIISSLISDYLKPGNIHNYYWRNKFINIINILIFYQFVVLFLSLLGWIIIFKNYNSFH